MKIESSHLPSLYLAKVQLVEVEVTVINATQAVVIDLQAEPPIVVRSSAHTSTARSSCK
jgi:hypothetical protein